MLLNFLDFLNHTKFIFNTYEDAKTENLFHVFLSGKLDVKLKRN
jgi:hypothetical protein